MHEGNGLYICHRAIYFTMHDWLIDSCYQMNIIIISGYGKIIFL